MPYSTAESNGSTTPPSACSAPRGRTTPVARVRPRASLSLRDFAELWSRRELLAILSLRDLRVRFKQTAVGVVWVVLQPLLTVIVFSLLFGRIAGFHSEGVPYPLFALSGLVAWNYFSQSLGRCVSCLVDASDLVGKVYFPRLVLPLAAVLTPLVDLAVTTLILLIVMLAFGFMPTHRLAALPLIVLWGLLTVLAFGLWLAVANARYRDIGHALPFFLQIGMYVSPVAYPLDIVPDRWRPLYDLNPMVGVIGGYRWCLLGTPWDGPAGSWPSLLAVLALVVGGLFALKRGEETLVDLL
ncbi:Polysialic acid transport protein KpsM [Aquisphaera giovannonii]|uniref:Transport permease protein n=1 Tax=Aquisphaera giovannonii TaxID=406548 RepID=A0A5B9W8B8_9BACT|nr:ABC transporter permease [Aquisphaera giovannonii]QEH36389.1 Polysialic acid transport protein KpsM [Aquisphaera giovannonii]